MYQKLHARETQVFKLDGWIVRGMALAGRMNLRKCKQTQHFVIPAQAGIQDATVSIIRWVRACAGMTLPRVVWN
jgi:hypothetical protein